jgi:hypothetical protein
MRLLREILLKGRRESSEEIAYGIAGICNGCVSSEGATKGFAPLVHATVRRKNLTAFCRRGWQKV